MGNGHISEKKKRNFNVTIFILVSSLHMCAVFFSIGVTLVVLVCVDQNKLIMILGLPMFLNLEQPSRTLSQDTDHGLNVLNCATM